MDNLEKEKKEKKEEERTKTRRTKTRKTKWVEVMTVRREVLVIVKEKNITKNSECRGREERGGKRTKRRGLQRGEGRKTRTRRKREEAEEQEAKKR